jgi:hypothetical protein
MFFSDGKLFKIKGPESPMKVTKLISEEHQIFKDRAVLTIAKIYGISRSSFDFGGSEYKEAAIKEIPVVKKDAEDKYGWWELKEGYYIAEFNENVEIKKGKTAIIQPWSERFPASATYLLRVLRGKNEKIRVVLIVSRQGIKIKKNARFAELMEI